ncbi:MAG TPA: hypothetical protein ENH07_08985 [Nitrospirae bacterium]|nr:hypothetical protein [Nitrospirota bacterium]
MRKWMPLIIALLMILPLASCKGKAPKKQIASPARKTISRKVQKKNPTPRTVQKQVSVPEIKQVEYNPAGRRDPFLSILALTKQKIERKRKKNLNPLENYDVADFRLLGTIYNGNGYFASILLPDGKAFTVKKGMTLGLYGGKIIDLGEDSLTVREYVMNYRGELKPKDTVLKLRKEEE